MSQAVPDCSTLPASTETRKRRTRPAPLTIPPDGEGLLSEAEARAALSVSRGTLWRLEKRGQLLPVRIGKSVRWRMSDLRAFLERCS
jgi:predicted DNA-binding transcriptional regulator AlpA